jgi:hypothetical protein
MYKTALKDIQDAAGYAHPDIDVCAKEASDRVGRLLERCEAAEARAELLERGNHDD